MNGNGVIINGIFCPVAQPYTLEQIQKIYMDGFSVGMDMDKMNNVVANMINGPIPPLDLTPYFLHCASNIPPGRPVDEWIASLTDLTAFTKWMISVSPPNLIAAVGGAQSLIPSRKRISASMNHPPDPQLFDSSLVSAQPSLPYYDGHSQKRARTSTDSMVGAFSTSHPSAFGVPLMNSYPFAEILGGSTASCAKVPRLDEISVELQRLSCIASSSDTPSSSTASPLSMPSPMPMDLSLLLKAQFSTPLPTPIIQPERQTSSTQDGGLTSVVDHIENLPVDLELPSSSTSAHSFDTDPIDQLQQLLLPTSSVQGDSISLDLTEEGEPQASCTSPPRSIPTSSSSAPMDEEEVIASSSSPIVGGSQGTVPPREDSFGKSYTASDWATILAEKLEEALDKLAEERKRVAKLEKRRKKARKERKKEKKLRDMANDRKEARKRMEANHLASEQRFNEDQEEESEREVPKAINFNKMVDTHAEVPHQKAEEDLAKALARIAELEMEDQNQKKDLEEKEKDLAKALADNEGLCARNQSLKKVLEERMGAWSRARVIREELLMKNEKQKEELKAKDRELDEAKREVESLKKLAEDDKQAKIARDAEMRDLGEQLQERKMAEANRRIDQLDPMDNSSCTSAQMIIPPEYTRQVRMSLCSQPGRSNVALRMWPTLVTTTDQVLEDYAASLDPPRSTVEVFLENDGMWERLDNINVSRGDIDRCNEMRKLEDNEDEMRLLRLIAYFNQGRKLKSLERIEHLFRIVDYPSIDEAVHELNEQTDYTLIFSFSCDPTTFYLKIYDRGIKVDGGLRRAVLSLVAASFVFRFEFNPEVKDVLTFFYLEAGLKDIDEPVPSSVRKAQLLVAKA